MSRGFSVATLLEKKNAAELPRRFSIERRAFSMCPPDYSPAIASTERWRGTAMRMKRNTQSAAIPNGMQQQA